MAVMTDGGMDRTYESMEELMKRKRIEQEQQTYGDANLGHNTPDPVAAPGGNNLAAGLGMASALSSGSDNSSPVSGALSGATAGALTGNPYAAAAGAAIGTIGAIAANKAKRKALARQIEGEKYKAIAQIQQQHGQAENAGIQNMIAGLRNAFLK